MDRLKKGAGAGKLQALLLVSILLQSAAPVFGQSDPASDPSIKTVAPAPAQAPSPVAKPSLQFIPEPAAQQPASAPAGSTATSADPAARSSNATTAGATVGGAPDG